MPSFYALVKYRRSHLAQTSTSKSSKLKLNKLVSALEDEFNMDEDFNADQLNCKFDFLFTPVQTYAIYSHQSCECRKSRR